MSKLQRLSYVAINQIAQREFLAYLGSQDKIKAAMLKNYLEHLDHITDIFTVKNWNLLIDHATITSQGHINFTFKDGTTITEDSH